MADLENGFIAPNEDTKGDMSSSVLQDASDLGRDSINSLESANELLEEGENANQHAAATNGSQQRPTHPSILPAFFKNLSTNPATKPPKEALKAVYAAGTYKAGLTLDVLMVQSFMAGLYIAMAGQLFLSVGGGILGAALFPTGILAVILTSAELFTGDALIFVASVLGGKVSYRSVLRNWTVSWIWNFIGCLAWAYFITYLSDSLEDVGQKDLAIKVALKKANQNWGNIFLKGMGANFMVCLGVWQATCAEEVGGKVLAVWFPIMGFVIMGLDHCIANQYLITVGMMYGADISIVRFLFLALLPATLGNLVGGGFFIGAVYWYVFDSMDASNHLRERIHHAWKRPRGHNQSTVTPMSSVHGFRRKSTLFRRSNAKSRENRTDNAAVQPEE